MSQGYADAVRARLTALASDGCGDFGSLLAGAQGADPRFVADWWRERGGSFRSDHDHDHDHPEWRPGLHPLCGEWYFTADCAAGLARRFGGGRLLALGTPTVAARARDAVLVERDAALVRARFGARAPTTFELDLGSASELPDEGALSGTFDAALLDPPWYAPHPLRWLALAGRRLGTGAILAMVLPPALQRPTAPDERRAALDLAAHLGPTTLETGAVRYDTPRFERLALARAGIEVPTSWRTADLLVTRVETQIEHPDVRLPVPPGIAAAFESFVVGPKLVLLTTASRPGPAAVHPIEGTQGFRWDQITSRDPRVASIDLWTSDSRVARISGREAIAAILHRIASGQTPSDATHDPGLASDLARLLEF